jgi:hypothetical protein
MWPEDDEAVTLRHVFRHRGGQIISFFMVSVSFCQMGC